MIARLARRTRGIPVVAASAATVAALRETGAPSHRARQPALVRRRARTSSAAATTSRPASTSCARARATCPATRSRITPSDLYDQVCRHTPDDADAVVIGGNGFRAVGAIAALEQTLERPVLTANQALLWAALRAAGADTSAVAGYGRIFRAVTATAIST